MPLGGLGLSWRRAGKRVLLAAVEAREEVGGPRGTTGLAVRKLGLGLAHEQRPTEGMASAEALKQERAPTLGRGPGRGVAPGALWAGQESEPWSESIWEHWQL